MQHCNEQKWENFRSFSHGFQEENELLQNIRGWVIWFETVLGEKPLQLVFIERVAFKAQNADLPVKKKSSASEVRPSAGIYVPKPRREAEEQRRLDGAPPPPPPTLPAPPKAKGQRSTRSAKTATEISKCSKICLICEQQ